VILNYKFYKNISHFTRYVDLKANTNLLRIVSRITSLLRINENILKF